MSEPRKNHLVIDGGQVKEDEHVATYKPIPDSDSGFRSSKPNLSKSKEQVSEEAEKLLQKEDEAKITTRVDMADAKYVVGDHRNGDAKIELDANKRQFSGLTKEELLKYADDPFWVRLRWFMFVLFWALWLCMLAGAIAIIVQAPKCAAPPAKTWAEIGPHVELSSADNLEEELALLKKSKVQAVFMNPCPNTYEVLDSPSCFDTFKDFIKKAKEQSIKVIVDLTANYVPTTHPWFQLSANGTAEFTDYFTWAVGKDFVENSSKPNKPNNWISTEDASAWSWNEVRKQYYLHQFAEDKADLNFHNADVVKRFDGVLRKWLDVGVAGVRLFHARQLLVNLTGSDTEPLARDKSAVGTTLDQYGFWKHSKTSDQPQLNELLAHWSHLVVSSGAEDPVFTIAEDGKLKPDFYLSRTNVTFLRPPSAKAISVGSNVTAEALEINARIERAWPILKLVAVEPAGAAEVAALAMLLPAAPVLGRDQLAAETNSTPASETFSHLAELRQDASIQHGHYSVLTVPANNASQPLLACARWKPNHTGYVAVYNPWGREGRANLTAVPSLPAAATVHRVSSRVRELTNYTNNLVVNSGDVHVPAYSTVVLSYVPKTTVEK